jgi:hypothetical protein
MSESTCFARFTSSGGEMTQHRNHCITVGVFTCACGYVYTRCFYSSIGKLGPARFLSFGPLLEPNCEGSLHRGQAYGDGKGFEARSKYCSAIRNESRSGSAVELYVLPHPGGPYRRIPFGIDRPYLR